MTYEDKKEWLVNYCMEELRNQKFNIIFGYDIMTIEFMNDSVAIFGDSLNNINDIVNKENGKDYNYPYAIECDDGRIMVLFSPGIVNDEDTPSDVYKVEYGKVVERLRD